MPTVINSFYLLTLGSYRAFYILNWIWRELDTNDRPPNPVSVIFGIVQTALYVDFAWVYWTRQRVKLRGGGIVDADDLRRGWILSRIFGKVAPETDDDDEESAPALGRSANGSGAGAGRTGRQSRAKWGARGISISADDGVLEADRARVAAAEAQEEGVTDGDNTTAASSAGGSSFTAGHGVDPDAKMKDPDELARALDDDDEDDPLPAAPSGVSNGSEWRDH